MTKPHTPFSPNEERVFELLASGYTNLQIAQRSGMSISAAAITISRIRDKIDGQNLNRVGMALWWWNQDIAS